MSATATHPTALPPGQAPVTLTREDYLAQNDLYTLLIQEIKLLGRHGASPYRRAAAPRVELQLTLLQQQIAPLIAG